MTKWFFFNALSPKHMGETTPENEGNVASHSRNSPHLTPGRLSRGGSLSKRQGLSHTCSLIFINCLVQTVLVGGFKYVLFSPLLGKMIQFD